ncbi:MAG: LysR family transcriptional regulator [Caldilineaceae bacterium]
MLNLYKLEIFAQVAEAGSFSGAAERLLMTQSGVSQHVQDLEASLGTQLFERGRRGVTLTPAGKKLADYTRQILTLVSEAENAVTDVERLAGGQVRVGTTPGVGVYRLPTLIQTFRQRYPKLTVDLQNSITPRIVEDLIAGRLDLGFIEGELNGSTQPQVGVKVLEEIEQLVVVGKKHRFWTRTQVTMQELDGENFIMRQPSSQTRIWLDQALREHGVRAHVAGEFDNLESIKRSVILGNALTILPTYAAEDEQAFGILRLIPIEGKPLMRTLKLVWDKRHFFSPITKSLLAHLQACCPALGEIV